MVQQTDGDTGSAVARSSSDKVMVQPTAGDTVTDSAASTASEPAHSAEPRNKKSGSHLYATWRRHISTIMAGACRFADRLKAANLVETDVCNHPACKGKRLDAKHWFYECKHNQQAISTTGKRIDDHINETRKDLTHNGMSRANTMEELFLQPCMHLCGICNEPNLAASTNVSWDRELQDIASLYQLAADKTKAIEKHEQLLNPTLFHEGKQGYGKGTRVAVYTDGSCALPKHESLAHAGWGVAFGDKGCNHNTFDCLYSTVQSSYRS